MKHLFKRWLTKYRRFKSIMSEIDLEKAFNAGYRAGYKAGWKAK